jgi:SAM-dependent methyltransferase
MKKNKHRQPAGEIKLDLGCGTSKQPGFLGVDRRAFPGVDVVHDLLVFPWPYKDSSVSEIHCSHVMEHFTGPQRVKIVNEMYRVLKPGASAKIITPHWASSRAYGDFTHQWPAVSEFWYFYLSREWRATNAPDNDVKWNPDGYDCDFEATWGYSMRQDLAVRNQEYQQYALANYKEAAQDLIATIKKRQVAP